MLSYIFEYLQHSGGNIWEKQIQLVAVQNVYKHEYEY